MAMHLKLMLAGVKHKALMRSVKKNNVNREIDIKQKKMEL